jgi:glutamyl/glutaminyl-tRNA synthetase
MRITHIFRGEDHLSNTATQAALFDYFDAPIPTYWHMPILCNIEGKKLSKRDFGFSLGDLRDAGYLPEAIDNYLAIIGGGTFAQEVMSLEELSRTLNFDHIHATGQVKYDVEKLNWINQQWIERLPLAELIERCVPFIAASHPQVRVTDQNQLATMIRIIKPNMRTLQDAAHLLDFYFTPPHVTHAELEQLFETDYAAVMALLKEYCDHTSNPQFVDTLKAEAKKRNIPLKHLFAALRLALTGKPSGLSIAELIEIVGTDEATIRIKKVVA